MLRIKALSIFLTLLLLISLSVFADSELRGYDKAKGGYQYLLLGEYPYEEDGTVRPLLWRILGIENNQALLLTDMVIDQSQITFVTDENDIKNYNYATFEHFTECDMSKWMNDTMLSTMFKGSPLVNALIDTELNKLFCLNKDQMAMPRYGFDKSIWQHNMKSRRAYATPYAKAKGLLVDRSAQTSPWWSCTLQHKGGRRVWIGSVDGHISVGALSRTNVGVRPAALLDLALVGIEAGAGTKDEPFILQYLGQDTASVEIRSEDAAEQGDPITVADGDLASEESAQSSTSAETEEPLPDISADLTPDEADQKEAPAETGKTPDLEVQPEVQTADTDEQSEAKDIPEEYSEQNKDGPDNSENAGSTELLLSFVGDISIGDATQSRSQENSLTNVIIEKGYQWPLSLLSDYFKNDDYTFANLEVNLTTYEVKRNKNIKYCMIGQPDFVNVLTEGGIDVVNTVNNHCFDFGERGYNDTLKTLDAAGLNHFGTIYPGTKNESDILGIADVKGIRIGMVGMTYPQRSDLKRISDRIDKLKNEMHCQLVVVSMHWGREGYTSTLESTQTNFSRQLIDAGADVIWGHHPHVLQPTVFYKGKPIFFSTGNLIFGTMGEVDKNTGIFQLRYDISGGEPVLASFSLVPCMTGNRGDYRPFELTDEEERANCRNILIYKKTIKNTVNLPQSFAQTGTVRITPDGQLLNE